MSPCEDEGVGGGDEASWNRICWLGSARLQENVFPFHSTLKRLWVESVSAKECSNSLISTSPCQCLIYLPCEGQCRGSGEGYDSCLLWLSDVGRWDCCLRLLQGPHPTVSLIFNFLLQSALVPAGNTFSHVSFLCSTGILLGRVQEAAGPGGEIRRQLKAEHKEAEFKAFKRTKGTDHVVAIDFPCWMTFEIRAESPAFILAHMNHGILNLISTHSTGLGLPPGSPGGLLICADCFTKFPCPVLVSKWHISACDHPLRLTISNPEPCFGDSE